MERQNREVKLPWKRLAAELHAHISLFGPIVFPFRQEYRDRVGQVQFHFVSALPRTLTCDGIMNWC